MGNSTWQDKIIIQAKKWPRGFRARFDGGVWQLLGADQDVQQEFKACAQRIQRELSLPQGDSNPVDALLYRLKKKGHHVWSSQRRKKYRTRSGNIETNDAHASVYPIRSALIEYLSQEQGADPSAQATSRAPARNSWQSAAGQRNRERQARALIIRALQRLGVAYYTKWPDFVREFYTNPQEHTEYRQPISPSRFQPPAFDRLNQTPKDWAKTADAAWQRHRDRFLQGCQSWVAAGMDEEIPAAKRTRRPRTPAGGGKRGDNTAIEQRYEWAAKYLLAVPLKEIAAQDGADPSTVGRVAREILREANWLEPAKAAKRGNSTV